MNIKNIIVFIIDKFLGKKLDFRVRLFNVLAMAGIIISLVSSVTCIINGEDLFSFLTNLLTSFVAFGLMLYASRTGRYQLCYIITIIVIFLIFFPLIFFVGGGYSGAMPFYFVFAIIFTIFMLEGKKALVISITELIVYIGICIYSYYNPESIDTLPTELAVLIDNIVGFSTVSAALGVTMFLHFRLYNQQQHELEAAREEALRLSEAKSKFLANMSHEIRTPINVMMGMNEMILRESESEHIKGYGLNIQNAGKTLLRLIDNILDVSRIEAGKLISVMESYQTMDLIEELSITGSELAGKYGLEFQCRIDESLPCSLIGDFIHIKQVAINFLSNSAKYTKYGGVTLSFSNEAYYSNFDFDSEKILLCISVEDSGIGIKPENIPSLFDAFVRADTVSNKYIEGTGLGLAIAKELTELMDGHIGVESTWGDGSIFHVEIPQKVGDRTPVGRNPQANIKKEKLQGSSFVAPECTLLAVDDNIENLQVICALLSHTMLRVDTAFSGAECIEAVKKSHYDVILMDYMMPDMDGIETLSRLKQIDGFKTPVIALTANIVADVKQKLINAGFSEYLSKPVMWSDLEASLISLLPKGRVTLSTPQSHEDIPREVRNKLSDNLSECGISLDDGLHYLSGDIRQYQKLAEFFIENYTPEFRKVRELAEKKDWEHLKFSIHSLKSKSRAVGAVNLSGTSDKLEKHLKKQTETTVENQSAEKSELYITKILSVLYYEWELAYTGLVRFAGDISSSYDSKNEHSSESKTAISDSVLDELLILLKHNRQPDALDAVDGLIISADSADIENKLMEIKEKIDDVEFREAERLLNLLILTLAER